MPQLDMPLHALKQYQGINPRPADFDAYWEKALSEVDALDRQVEICEADFQAPYAVCSHLYFNGTGGGRVHAKLLRPREQKGDQPGIVHFHGYRGQSSPWLAYLPYVAMGYTVAALDCRGQAGLSKDAGGVAGNTHNGHIIRGLQEADPHQLLYRHIFLDTVLLTRIVMEMDGVDAERLGAYGGSQGGALTIACAALEPRIKRAVAYYPFLSDYKRVWEMDLAKGAYEELQWYFRTYDPLHETAEAVFEKLGYIDIHFLAPRIQAQVLFFATQIDSICPPSTQFAAYNAIQTDKELVLYPSHGHEGLPGSSEREFQFFSEL